MTLLRKALNDLSRTAAVARVLHRQADALAGAALSMQIDLMIEMTLELLSSLDYEPTMKHVAKRGVNISWPHVEKYIDNVTASYDLRTICSLLQLVLGEIAEVQS